MASPKSDSEGASPRDGVTKQNISTGSSPAGGPIVAQEDTEGDVSDSAFGDDAESSTASISSSILEYRKFQGRTFHSERYNTEYFTPNDEQQRNSIDTTHHVLTLLLDGKLTLVPLKDDTQRVLDVGTGTVTLPMNTLTLRSSEHGLTNDVLSFYKEEMAGETHNYIHNRGWYEDKDPESVFAEIVDDITTKSQQMRLVLKGREPYLNLLNTHLLGYIAFHKLNSLYRLWGVGLGEDATDRTVLGV